MRGERGPTRPLPQVDNEAAGRSRRSLNRAIRDLKRVDLWGPLTAGLYRIDLSSRVGRANVPSDGHLADAYATGVIEEEGKGALCDVMFFVQAVKRDLKRWRRYHADGRVAQAPPSNRHFWAMILAHELAHCLRRNNGERAAKQWEGRAYRALVRT
jgi:hypothetical protein